MFWTMLLLGFSLILFFALVVTLTISKRYDFCSQCDTRNFWSALQEWWHKVLWAWAPREEKVGLVKAQHPTAHSVPGLYRQSVNSSQNSDSDIRLDSQGGFTRFEAVDRDLHMPLVTENSIPPQPLRPAPQPQTTPRPRPSLLHSNNLDYIKMQEIGTIPLTPPPFLMNESQRSAQPQVFAFPTNYLQGTNKLENPRMDNFGTRIPFANNQRNCSYTDQNSWNANTVNTEANLVNGGVIKELCDKKFYDVKSLDHRRDLEKSPFGDREEMNDDNSCSKHMAYMNSVRSIYSAQKTSNLSNGFNAKHINFSEQNANVVNKECENDSRRSRNKLQGMQKVSQYIQSLPDGPAHDQILPNCLEGNQVDSTDSIFNSFDSSSPVAPPPPAPPDPPPNMKRRKTDPTTGEQIFRALRSVNSESYIDATEFYNSALSNDQVRCFSMSPVSRSLTMDNTNIASHFNDEAHDSYYDKSEFENDIIKRRSDLYSPELNLEAQITAQEVYNSLQDPSAFFLSEYNMEPHHYMADPSFTRTSEDIFNSLEQKRKNMERLSSQYDFTDIKRGEFKRRSCHQLYSALEEVQLKRQLSQSLEESIFSNYTKNDFIESFSMTRRASLGLDPELSIDEANLKRAVSCDSVCSDTSVVLGDIDDALVVGHVCIGVEYERWCGRGADSDGDVTLSVLEARDLVLPDGQPARNTFARVRLLPHRQPYVQTRIYKNCPSPSYQEKFLFPLDGRTVGRTLLVEVFSLETNPETEPSLLGEATLRMGPTPRPPITTWLPLISPTLPLPLLGELMFSLSYLPTAERLTLVVVKARNLRGTTSKPGDFYVKVYLLQQGKKIHKKKTTVKKGEKSPIFNEAIIFNVPSTAMQLTQLRLTVVEVTGDQSSSTKVHSVGHIIVGASTSGRTLVHWRRMLAALRRPVAMWHPLRK